MRSGSCLCGNVAFHFSVTPPAPSVCHCGQCRRQSGHTWSSTFIPEVDLIFDRKDGLKWYRSSDTAQRGFCGTCGSFLFWKHDAEDTISVSMGSLAEPTGLRLGKHIFTADKGDYYDIADGVPQK